MLKLVLSISALIAIADSLPYQADDVNPAVENDVLITFFFSNTQEQRYTIANFHEILSHPQFIRTRQTVIYHYGFSQTPNSDNVVDLVNAYRTTNEVNFILIHYDAVTTNIVTNTNSIASAIASALIRLFDSGYSSGLTHLVGFSLGAQVMARASRNVQSQTSRRHVIGRLTGLDPGQLGPPFITTVGRFSPADAQWTETIHTESVGLGEHESRGAVQFFVNGGVAQPHCTQALPTAQQTCSHNFAVFLWNEAVRARAARFPSLPCPTWDQFIAGGCNSNAPVGNIGPVSQSTLRGNYFLRTNLSAPWSRPVATP